MLMSGFMDVKVVAAGSYHSYYSSIGNFSNLEYTT